MLEAVKGKDRRIGRVERKDDRLYLFSEAGMYRLEMKSKRAVRITYTQKDAFSKEDKPGIVCREISSGFQYEEDEEKVTFCTGEICVVVNKETASFIYLDGQGKLLLKEKSNYSKELEEFPVYQPVEEGMKVEKVVTADGVKDVVREADKVLAGNMYHTRLSLEWQEQEALYGLGQQEEGYLNLRGKTLYLHQANRKIAIPLLVSNLGYGLLMDTYSPMIFRDTGYGSSIYTEADEEMDFYFINGSSMDGVIDEYRKLTGKAPMLPKWAYGYIQSQERYETADELLEIAREYHKRGIGLDAIVLDWLSWEDGHWGQKAFDKERFSDPSDMTKQLHDEGIHFIISIWPNMDEKTQNYREFKEKGLLLPGTTIYNALRKEARELYWKQAEEGLFCHGIDAWWCDNSEPFTPEWNHRVCPEPEKAYEEYCSTVSNHLPADKGNAYALYHAQAIYEGQRNSGYGQGKRVVNLTRSAYTGQQRFGTILWSGDIAADWNTLKRQIAEGLSVSASGFPYWTVDIGAFFVKEGEPWFWKGNYEDTTNDLGYRELFVRWYQWACFLPVFRGHGTDCRRELWQFGEEGDLFYDALVKTNHLRYRLMPYIYSLAGKVWTENASIIKPLVFSYPEDENVWDIKDQYLFGESMMICPVTTPMYYEKGSKRLENVQQTRKVYLPEGNGWYDYFTGAYHEGGQWIEAQADLMQIPVFVKAGSIIPHGKAGLSAADASKELLLKIYPGKDCSFTLYEDEGDGYGYEQGVYRLTYVTWDESKQKVLIEKDDCNDIEVQVIGETDN